MSKSKLRVYSLGGAGINIGAEVKRKCRSDVLRNAEFIGLDTSTANVPADGIFQVDALEDGTGSGKNREKNKPKIKPYVEQMMSRYKPGDVNVLIFSSSSSGGQIGPYVLRHIMQQKLPVICLLITDTTSLVEMENTALTIKSIDGQRRTLNSCVVVDLIDNGCGLSRRDINQKAVNRLDALSIFLTEHEEYDYEDMRNFLNYSNVSAIAPSILSVKLLTGSEELERNIGSAITLASLYVDGGDVKKVPGPYILQSTGVLTEGLSRPENVTELHMILEHGKFVKDALDLADRLEERSIETRATFKAPTNLTDELNDDGMAD